MPLTPHRRSRVLPRTPKHAIALLALTLAACGSGHHAYRVSLPPEHVTPVVWHSPEARARDVKLWHDTILWNEVELWNRVVTWNAAIAAQSGCPYAPLIREVWQTDAEWAITIARRESNCEPGARNPSGASGLFQLLGHSDLLIAACGSDAWADPTCNVKAAWLLYQGAGRAPWNL